MANQGEPSYPNAIPFRQAHEMGIDGATIELEEHVRNLAMELERVKRYVLSEWQSHRILELDFSPIRIEHTSSYKDYDNKGRVSGKRRYLRDLSGLTIKAPQFDGNLNLENYLDYEHAIERIFKLNEYNDEKAFKLATQKMKGYAYL